MRAFAWAAFLALTFSSLAFAAEQLTVVSIDGGKAWYQTQDSSWRDLKVGQKIAVGSTVRTEKNAVMRLITNDTSMLRISGVNPQVIRLAGTASGSSTQRGLAAVLEEFLHSRARATIAATRGAPGQNREAEYYQIEWDSLMGSGDFRPEAIPRFMDAAAYYKQRERPDRTASLLRKLARENPDNAAFDSLAVQALTAYGSPASLQVVIRRGSEQVPSRPTDVLKLEDEIHVRFTSRFESILHVYVYSATVNGSGTLARLYPPPGAAIQIIPPNSPLDLPSPGLQYSMASMEVHEYLWAWSCAVAIAGATEDEANRRVQSGIAGSGMLTADLLVSAAPPQCLQAFAYSFSRAPGP